MFIKEKEDSCKTWRVWDKSKDYITRITWIRDQYFLMIASSHLRRSEELEKDLKF